MPSVRRAALPVREHADCTATVVLNVLVVVLALPFLACTTYLAWLALLSAPNPLPPRAVRPRPMRFDVVVPAHDEETGIAATVASLLSTDYPASARRVVVVADNCSDATAQRARDAGAHVLVRTEATLPGKGRALAFAIAWSIGEGFADAVAVVDADTLVTPNLLSAFAARMSRGSNAVQADYRVANVTASWRTRLMHLAFTLFHTVRSRARERMGVSAGLRGNGMAFTLPLLKAVPADAFSLVEDVEYGIRLGRAGYRVDYAGEAQVFGEMVALERGSRSQRQRWEGGRATLARDHAWRLLAQGLGRRDPVLLDLAVDLLVPPLTRVALGVAVGLAATLLLVAGGRAAPWTLVPWGASLLGLGLYIARGAWLAGVGPAVVLDIARAPVYMLWKLLLPLRERTTGAPRWVRTAREPAKRNDDPQAHGP